MEETKSPSTACTPRYISDEGGGCRKVSEVLCEGKGLKTSFCGLEHSYVSKEGQC